MVAVSPLQPLLKLETARCPPGRAELVTIRRNSHLGVRERLPHIFDPSTERNVRPDLVCQ